jgi:hypothetical protein
VKHLNTWKTRTVLLVNYGGAYTGVPPYPRAIRSKTYRGYVKPRIIPNAIYKVIFV